MDEPRINYTSYPQEVSGETNSLVSCLAQWSVIVGLQSGLGLFQVAYQGACCDSKSDKN